MVSLTVSLCCLTVAVYFEVFQIPGNAAASNEFLAQATDRNVRVWQTVAHWYRRSQFGVRHDDCAK